MSVESIRREIAVKSSSDLAALEENIIRISGEYKPEERVELEVVFSGGEYAMTRPLTLDAEAHGELSRMSIAMRAVPGETPVIHSLSGIKSSEFKHFAGNVYKYCFAADEKGRYPVFRELYCDGVQLPIAKSESFIHPFGMPDRQNYENPENERFLYVREDVAKPLLDYGDISSAELTMFLEWEWCNAPVSSINTSDVREHEGVKYYCLKLSESEHSDFIKKRHPLIDIRNRRMHLTNHPAYITPGTYCYNAKTGELYYALSDGERIEDKQFSYPALEQLLVFCGIKNVGIYGLSFTGVGSKFIAENMYFACQSNAEKRAGLLKHAAVLTKNMKDLTVDGCTFRDLGGNGILMTDSSIRVNIRNSRFYRISMSAIVIGNRTTAWENPQNRNFDINIVNNNLHTVGHDYPAAGGIYVSMVDGMRILHNTIENTAYSGITVGWGWSRVYYSLGEKINLRDVEIAYNKIIDFMQLMRDGAAIYVLGANCTWDRGGQFNFMHDNYAEREMYTDASKRGYYMDGSSTNWECFNNVIFGVRLPVFSQFHVPDQYTHHNYIHDIYTDFPIDPGNHAPDRDTIVGDCYCVPEGKAALFAKYPKAQQILESAGSSLEF